MSKKEKSSLEIIGDNLKRIRIEKKLTLKKVSELTGLRVEYLSKIEHANAKGLNLSKFECLLEGLDLSAEELLS